MIYKLPHPAVVLVGSFAGSKNSTLSEVGVPCATASSFPAKLTRNSG